MTKPAAFASPEEFNAFVTATRARLDELGLGAAGAPLARVQGTAYTTSSEWFGELGLAVREVEAHGALPPEIGERLARIRATVRRGFRR
jgi:hypothetical protein